MTFTAREKAEEASREIAQRQGVYPRLVAQRRLTPAKADRQIAIMREILADYEAQAETEAARERLL